MAEEARATKATTIKVAIARAKTISNRLCPFSIFLVIYFISPAWLMEIGRVAAVPF